jgi:hypothetical protein
MIFQSPATVPSRRDGKAWEIKQARRPAITELSKLSGEKAETTFCNECDKPSHFLIHERFELNYQV